MSVEKGQLSIHTENFLPIIKKWLYSDRDIFVRELVSNCCDAVAKRRMTGETPEDYSPRVTVRVDKEHRILSFTDDGVGMTAEEVRKYINQVAFSGANDFLEKYKDSGEQIIGHFGLGFYSAFMVADRVTIETLSGTEGASPVRWTSEDGMAFTMEDGSRTQRGTDVILHIGEEEKEFLEEYRVREVLKRYCGFMATPVYFDVVKKEEPAKEGQEGEKAAENKEPKGPELINDTPALWLKAPKDCTDEEYKKFYRDVFHTFDDPLFYVHLNVDYPFNLKGILYFPKLTNDFGTREGEIKLFSGQVFVADNIKEVIPEFLMLLKGVIDCPDLPLNVSRSFLQNDGYVKKLSAYITRKVADKLTGLFNSERDNYQKYWDDIHPFVKYGCMRDAKFFDQVKDTLLYKTTKGEYLTLQEYLSKNEGKLGGKKVIYTNDPTRQSASVAMYDAEGIDVVVMDALIDLNFLSFMEYSSGVEGLTFARVDADSQTFQKEMTEDEKKQSEEDEKKLADVLHKATGKEDLTVKLASLKDESLPAMLTQEEQGRRFSEMSRIYGQNFKLPETHTLVLNVANPVVKSLISGEADEETRGLIAAQLYDLARMSTRPLEKEEVTAFLSRSNKLLELLSKR